MKTLLIDYIYHIIVRNLKQLNKHLSMLKKRGIFYQWLNDFLAKAIVHLAVNHTADASLALLLMEARRTKPQ